MGSVEPSGGTEMALVWQTDGETMEIKKKTKNNCLFLCKKEPTQVTENNVIVSHKTFDRQARFEFVVLKLLYNYLFIIYLKFLGKKKIGGVCL